jgi:hypothetical protein
MPEYHTRAANVQSPQTSPAAVANALDAAASVLGDNPWYQVSAQQDGGSVERVELSSDFIRAYGSMEFYSGIQIRYPVDEYGMAVYLTLTYQTGACFVSVRASSAEDADRALSAVRAALQ